MTLVLTREEMQIYTHREGKPMIMEERLGDATAGQGAPRTAGHHQKPGEGTRLGWHLDLGLQASRSVWKSISGFCLVGFDTEFRSCCPGCSTMAQPWLTATSTSQVQEILLSQPPK